jgi:hypothetical protein
MDYRDVSPRIKALQINLDPSVYGTFAEIGAGQEVARHFFQAGKAASTIAKSISAYDMAFSDEIYGKSGRYVSEARLSKMLDHEFSLLGERLPARRDTSRFFAFADTVATSTESEKSHGWMGIRFQSRPNGPTNEIVIHVKLWDTSRLQQQDALGILGVNLIHMAFYPSEDPKDRITALLDNLTTKRIEVNMIRFSGDDVAHLDNRLMSLELVHQGLTEAVLFGPKGEVLHSSDALYGKPIFVMRGTFRPITATNLEILEMGLEQFKKLPMNKDQKPEVLFEITMNNLKQEGDLDNEDFLNRVDTLSALGYKVLISKFYLFYQLKSFLRQCTSQMIGIAVGASHLEKMFEEKFYKSLPGGLFEGFSRLFDDKTKLFVYPFKSEELCLTAKVFHPAKNLTPLYQFMLQNEMIVDLMNCDNVDTSMHSRQVREMLASGDPKWKELVPKSAREVIESRQLFGFKPNSHKKT